METQKVYKVTTEEDASGNYRPTVLGYATGKPEDIENFYKHQQIYGLQIKEIKVVNITPKVLPIDDDFLGNMDLEGKMREVEAVPA